MTQSDPTREPRVIDLSPSGLARMFTVRIREYDGEQWISVNDLRSDAALPAPPPSLDRLREALRQIAETSAIPDTWEPYDSWGDYNARTDGCGGEISVDGSNSGDVHDHGYAMGKWAAAKIARAALEGAPADLCDCGHGEPHYARPYRRAALEGAPHDPE